MNLKFSSIIVFTLLMFSFIHTKAEQAPKKKQPNVLFIAVDDLRTMLGCYGDKSVISPNIDKLAKQGMLFKQAYCQQAICGPSRISLLSGLRPENTGILTLQQPIKKELPDAVTIPQAFKNKGYRTVSIGKIYHHATDDTKGWTKIYDRPATRNYATPTEYVPHKKGKNGKAYEAGDVADTHYSDGQYPAQAIAELKKHSGDPLFLAVGFNKPHLPFLCPKKYWDMYDAADFKIPSTKKPIDAPAMAFTDWGELRSYANTPKKGDISREQTIELIHGYHACVSFIDAQIGIIMDELENQGLLDNTIVVLWGDHGWKLGEYGDWCKHTNFELDTHVPLLFSAPGYKKGVESKALVEFVDIYPSLAELCGLDIPADIEGHSFVPLLSNPKKDWKSGAFSIYPRGKVMGYSMRTDKYRYTEWKNKKTGVVEARELYDHSTTNLAVKNLVDDPKYADMVKTLSVQLKAGWKGALPK